MTLTKFEPLISVLQTDLKGYDYTEKGDFEWMGTYLELSWTFQQV